MGTLQFLLLSPLRTFSQDLPVFFVRPFSSRSVPPLEILGLLFLKPVVRTTSEDAPASEKVGSFFFFFFSVP